MESSGKDFPSPQPSPRIPGEGVRGARILIGGLGSILLAIWAVWWLRSFAAGHLVGPIPWFSPWPSLGTDFDHTFLAVRAVIHGINPYKKPFGDYRGLFAYPPLVLGLFLWTVPFSQTAGEIIWISVIAVVMIAATWYANRTRADLRLRLLPLPFLIAAVLLSTPVVFAMERGNCDALIVLLIIFAASALKGRGKTPDLCAGIFLAAATWIKVYPGLILIAASALRRWRLLTAAWIAALLIPAALFLPTMQFFQTEGYRTKFISSAANLHQDPSQAASDGLIYPPLETYSHSISIYWKTFWTDAHIYSAARLPGIIGAGLLLAPLLAWVSFKVRLADAGAIAFPFFLWVAMLATFWMPVSYDYNLIYLPLVTAAVWDARDGWLAHCLLLPVLIYWQPLQLNVSMELLLLFKLMALAGLGLCITHRAMEHKDERRDAETPRKTQS